LNDKKYFLKKNRKKFRKSAEIFKKRKFLSRNRPQPVENWAFAGVQDTKKAANSSGK